MASPSGQALKQRRQDLLLGAAGPGSLEASAEGKALLESRELRLGRGLEFKDAVWAIARVREASPREVAALVDSLVDAMATSSDSLSLRAAFFLACSLLGGGGGGGGTAGSTAQRLELLAAMSTSGYQHCLAQDRRTALRSYRLLRSAALGAAASLDTAGNRVMQDIGAGANPAGSAALHHAHGERASPATCPSPRLPARRRRWFPLRFRAFFAGSMTFSG